MLFLTSMLGLIPLAERLGFVTEEMAKHTNKTVGGLLNATMGNVTEVIIALVALNNGLLRVVQVSLIGSILSNLLLVLGTACFVGGLKHSIQKFNKTAVSTNSGILLIAVITMLFPAVLDATHEAESGDSDEESILLLSRLSSGASLLVYGLFIIYQLKTHRHLYEGGDDDDEPALLGFKGALLLMTAITAVIALLSEVIVGCIEEAATQMGLPILFIGTILLPIVGNAAEHASAVMFAYKNQMDVAIGISVGSASQISLFVIPLCVLVAMPMNQPLSLDFHIFETSCIFITVVVVSFVTANGETDWLKGAMLLVAYFLVACSFWIHR